MCGTDEKELVVMKLADHCEKYHSKKSAHVFPKKVVEPVLYRAFDKECRAECCSVHNQQDNMSSRSWYHVNSNVTNGQGEFKMSDNKIKWVSLGGK